MPKKNCIYLNKPMFKKKNTIFSYNRKFIFFFFANIYHTFHFLFFYKTKCFQVFCALTSIFYSFLN